MTGFSQKLSEQAKEIRRLATGKQFEQDGYHVAWTEEQDHGFKNPGTFDGQYTMLTIDRYKSGPSEGTRGKSNYKAPRDTNNYYYVALNSPVWNYEYSKSKWVSDLFHQYDGLTGAQLKPLYSKIKGVCKSLCATEDWSKDKDRDPLGAGYVDENDHLCLTYSLRKLRKWTGDAAGAFDYAFSPWPHIARRNFYLAVTVRQGIECMIAIVAAVQRDVLRMADVAIGHLSALEEGPALTASDKKILLAITGTVVGLVLAPEVTAPAVAIAGFGIAQEVLENMDSGEPTAARHSREPVHIGGGTPAAILSSLASAVTSLQGDMYREIASVEEHLVDTNNEIVSKPELFRVTFDKGDHKLPHHSSEDPSSSRLLGPPKSTSVDTDDMRRITDDLRIAVVPIFAANKQLAATSGAEDGVTFGGGVLPSPRPAMTAWGLLRDLLEDFTDYNGRQIRNTAECTNKYSVKLGAVDRAVGSKIERQIESLEGTTSGHRHRHADVHRHIEPR